MRIDERAQAHYPRERGYNLFRNKQRPDLLCAVPEDYPVPGFIIEEEWVFERALRPSDAAPPGFHARAASAGVRFIGFYLFYLITSGRGDPRSMAA
ncbi:hypothetical protein [Microvirga roseola]|uniref:hypothetical protein n=1 Tax=Microvirga roseola TaxID=2883126 RepID=UPI001E2E8169|nr:hypothetical protein [Microvirga roseola]